MTRSRDQRRVRTAKLRLLLFTLLTILEFARATMNTRSDSRMHARQPLIGNQLPPAPPAPAPASVKPSPPPAPSAPAPASVKPSPAPPSVKQPPRAPPRNPLARTPASVPVSAGFYEADFLSKQVPRTGVCGLDQRAWKAAKALDALKACGFSVRSLNLALATTPNVHIARWRSLTVNKKAGGDEEHWAVTCLRAELARTRDADKRFDIEHGIIELAADILSREVKRGQNDSRLTCNAAHATRDEIGAMDDNLASLGTVIPALFPLLWSLLVTLGKGPSTRTKRKKDRKLDQSQAMDIDQDGDQEGENGEEEERVGEEEGAESPDGAAAKTDPAVAIRRVS